MIWYGCNRDEGGYVGGADVQQLYDAADFYKSLVIQRLADDVCLVHRSQAHARPDLPESSRFECLPRYTVQTTPHQGLTKDPSNRHPMLWNQDERLHTDRTFKGELSQLLECRTFRRTS